MREGIEGCRCRTPRMADNDYPLESEMATHGVHVVDVMLEREACWVGHDGGTARAALVVADKPIVVREKQEVRRQIAGAQTGPSMQNDEGSAIAVYTVVQPRAVGGHDLRRRRVDAWPRRLHLRRDRRA